MQHLYYQFKPFLPRALRTAIRRRWMERRRERFRDVWPINETAGQKPEGWTGWPEGKQFAFVLTHDVEGKRGLENVRPLMELEMSLGFRSCFNFVPEGEYRVPADLIAELKTNGFEVGVHGLKHDGKLYRSRKIFRERAKRINHYLKEWGAVGFRSPFMHHNLEWLHDLEIEYDCSTFDTDPFEPQPDGAGTIFPFWVTKEAEPPTPISNLRTPNSDLRSPISQIPSPRSYVELPYTLPQDSTLFLMLRERGIDVWRRKLDWVVAKGGMALLTTHPDYIEFGGEKESGENYPAEWYGQFLREARERVNSLAWHVNPAAVADWYRRGTAQQPASAPSTSRTSGRQLPTLKEVEE